ncbi:MAG: 1-aminocyclopropane-1-carboxylate deaminase/D-cysteine desulfhydrase [Acidimicrobiales bacterium]
MTDPSTTQASTTQASTSRSSTSRSSATQSAARDRLLALPTAGLGAWPTPLQRIDRFARAVDPVSPPEVYIKRDDVQGVALAGNKVRKFDLVIGDALVNGVDTIVTTGAIQSNSARTGAAAAAATGLDCVLLLSGREPASSTANLLLDRLLGADVRFAGNVGWRELNDGVDAIVAELAAKGHKALAAPVGCSSPLGSLGFARAFLELDAQLTEAGIEPSAIVHTTTSGGTHAGLLVGRALTGRAVPVIGIDAGRMYRDQPAVLAKMANAAADLLDFDPGLVADDVVLVTDQVGDSYGRHTSAGAEAIGMLARTEAIITDPVYSGKGLAGLVAMLRGESAVELTEGPVVFWHTGGFHALFDPNHGDQMIGNAT